MYNFSNFNNIEKHNITRDKLKDDMNMLIRQGKVSTVEWNEIMIKIDEIERNTTKLRILKSRHSGQTGEAGALYYDRQEHKLVNLD